jgi:hypothetical protein
MTAPSTNPGFTQVWNALIVDRRLNATAFRVAIYLASKTPDWTTREHNVTETLGIGRDAYRAAMRQLSAAGYITRGKTFRDPKTGRMRSEPSSLNRRLIVADPAKAQVPPKTGFQHVGEPGTGNGTSAHRTSYSTLDNSTRDTQQEERSSAQERNGNGHEVQELHACECGHSWPQAVNAAYMDWHRTDSRHFRNLQHLQAQGEQA